MGGSILAWIMTIYCTTSWIRCYILRFLPIAISLLVAPAHAVSGYDTLKMAYWKPAVGSSIAPSRTWTSLTIKVKLTTQGSFWLMHPYWSKPLRHMPACMLQPLRYANYCHVPQPKECMLPICTCLSWTFVVYGKRQYILNNTESGNCEKKKK